VAEHLVRSSTLAVPGSVHHGRSNGGLLFGVRSRFILPESVYLSRCLAVGVISTCSRYYSSPVARAWFTEYGSSSDAAQFRFLCAIFLYFFLSTRPVRT